jgi:hypothetical protein
MPSLAVQMLFSFPVFAVARLNFGSRATFSNVGIDRNESGMAINVRGSIVEIALLSLTVLK